MKMSEHCSKELVCSAEKPKKGKRKLAVRDDDDHHVLIPSRLHKSTMFSLLRPLYLLQRGPGHIRWATRERLCSLLQKLFRQRNWAEASGILSVLLNDTGRIPSPSLNRLKFTCSMELLKHLHGDRLNQNRIRNVYDIWLGRIKPKKTVRLEEKVLVYMEFIQFLLTQGNVETADQAATSLMKENQIRSHPMSNLIVGLTSFELWYFKLPEEMKLIDLDQEIHIRSQSETSGERFSNQVGNSEGNYKIYSHEANTSLNYDSDTSVMNGKWIVAEAVSKRQTEVPAKIDAILKIGCQSQEFQTQSFHSNSVGSEDFVFDHGSHIPDLSIFSSLEGLESWLLPLRLPRTDEQLIQLQRQMLDKSYKDAMKYLKIALYSTPPTLVAFLPLMQLLLIGGQVDEALTEIEKFCSTSNASFPFRLRASLLECFRPNDSELLATSLEDTLKKDPTCSLSLSKLVSMHQTGDYHPESLVEMIALHLEATYADSETWKEFAICFLKLSQYGEDRMSACLNGEEDEPKPKYSARYSKTPELFTEGNSGKSWKLRCRWWLTRHFSKKTLASEIASGDLQLVTYKAACASHIYGHEIAYVVKAYAHLQQEGNDRDLVLFLQNHIRNCTRISSSFKERT